MSSFNCCLLLAYAVKWTNELEAGCFNNNNYLYKTSDSDVYDSSRRHLLLRWTSASLLSPAAVPTLVAGLSVWLVGSVLKLSFLGLWPWLQQCEIIIWQIKSKWYSGKYTYSLSCEEVTQQKEQMNVKMSNFSFKISNVKFDSCTYCDDELEGE